jgi:hypothetical protein
MRGPERSGPRAVLECRGTGARLISAADDTGQWQEVAIPDGKEHSANQNIENIRISRSTSGCYVSGCYVSGISEHCL